MDSGSEGAEQSTLADLRHSAHLTQQALARASGISRTMIAKAELGLHVPNLDTLQKLAEVLGSGVLTARYGWNRKPSGTGRRGRPPLNKEEGR